jgi:hypothetical protein
MGLKVLAASFDAVGGPAISSMGADGFPRNPTSAGTYRVSHCGQHSSKRYAGWSTFRWGSAVKEEGDAVLVSHDGKWVDIRTVGLDRESVRQTYKALYGQNIVPKTWVFNDFGHMTCYLYRDRNNNRHRDENEPIHGEFIHTTPDDEASVDGVSIRNHLKIELVESHGCIHVKPLDMDRLIDRGFLARNTLVVVHPYSVLAVPIGRAVHGYRKPYSLHFLPGAAKLLVVAMSNY